MYKMIFFMLTVTAFSQLSNAEVFEVDDLIDEKAINCNVFSKPESKFIQLINDFSSNTKSKLRLNKANQILTINNHAYSGVQGHQYYKTKQVEQNDLAVNLQVFNSHLIKIAFQSYKSNEGESGIYYLVFKGSPATVLFQLKKTMEDDWNVENTLEETPQGNSKLVCVYAG